MSELQEIEEEGKEMTGLDTSPLEDILSKKFPWKKLSDEDLIYTKVDSDQDYEGSGLLELSKGRWKKSALLERKPKETGSEGEIYGNQTESSQVISLGLRITVNPVIS